MQFEQMLMDRWRNVKEMDELEVIHGLLDYAVNVRDQLEVYQFMQEQRVGVLHAGYWLACLSILQKQGAHGQLVTLLHKIRSSLDMDENWRIDHFEILYIQHLENLVKSRFRGKRRFRQFENSNGFTAGSNYRQVGSVEVCIDQNAPNLDKIRVLLEIVDKDIPGYRLQLLEDYNMEQEKKPWSFLQTDRQIHLEIIKTCQSVASDSNRRLMNMFETKCFQKDEEYRTSNNDQNIDTNGVRKLKRMTDSSEEDSVQILKSIQRKKGLYVSPKSPRFNNESKQMQRSCSYPLEKSFVVEKCRSSNHEGSDTFGFSFGRTRQAYDSEKKSIRSQERLAKSSKFNDNAFLFNSFSQDFSQIDQSVIQKEDFELQLIIKEIQRENYEDNEAQGLSCILDNKKESKRSGNSYDLEDLIDLEDKSPDTIENHYIEENPEMDESDHLNHNITFSNYLSNSSTNNYPSNFSFGNKQQGKE